MTDVIRKRVRHVKGFSCDALEVDKETVSLEQAALWFDIPGDDYTVEWSLDANGPYLVVGPQGSLLRGVYIQHIRRKRYIPVCFIPEEWGDHCVSRRVVKGGE